MATGVTGYGVISAGFYAKPLTVIDDEVDADLRGILGESAGTDENGKIPLESMAGQLKSLIVDALAAQWDLQQSVYDSMDPNKNTGASQDVIASLSGITRNPARYSVATGICVGDPLTELLAGRVVTVPSSGSRFASLSDAELAAALNWSTSTGYAVGDVVTNNQNIYRCITAGTSAGSGGPTTESDDITDNTAHWQYLGDGTAWVGVPFQAENTGAVGALAGHMTGIATPVNGWNAVHNPYDAALGNARETDAAFRRRRNLELAAAGNTTEDAIRANILAVNSGSADPNHEPPVACLVLVNDTDYPNSEGVPPHSIECVVQGGTTADIAQAIWDSVGAGTRTHGSRSDSVTDSQGNTQTVNWSRPTEVPIYVTCTGRYRASDWPAGSEALVAETMLSAMLTYTADWPIARDVRTAPLIAAIMRGPAETDDNGDAVVPASAGSDPVAGLLEVDPLYIGLTASPTDTAQISVDRRSIATFDSSRCVFTAATEDD